MNLPDEIKTIDEFNEVTTTINRSKFIAQAFHIETEEEVKASITKSKKKFFNASHHCFALKLANSKIRYSDDGEPNGTAGIRILNAIEHFNLKNQLVIVSRVFGGNKLGVGLLGKSYYESAFQVLNESKIKTQQLFQRVSIFSEFNQVGFIRRILSTHNSILTDSKYESNVQISCLLKSNEIEQISKTFMESGKGRISINLHEDFIYK
jgi:uncharacterized YigZ family protein